jgi:hypothetical protein
MPRLTENKRLRAISKLQSGLVQYIVAGHFSVQRNTIQALLWRFRQSADTWTCCGLMI